MCVPAGDARNLAPVAGFRCLDGLVVFGVEHGWLAENAAHDRQKDESHDHRCAEHDDERDREIAHELAGHARPEQHGQKRADHGRCRADDRPEHAPCGFRERVARIVPFRHLALGIFDHNDRTVDENAHREQHRKQNHEVEREAGAVQHEETDKERGWNGDADEQSRAQAQRRHDDDHHETLYKRDTYKLHVAAPLSVAEMPECHPVVEGTNYGR